MFLPKVPMMHLVLEGRNRYGDCQMAFILGAQSRVKMVTSLVFDTSNAEVTLNYSMEKFFVDFVIFIVLHDLWTI